MRTKRFPRGVKWLVVVLMLAALPIMANSFFALVQYVNVEGDFFDSDAWILVYYYDSGFSDITYGFGDFSVAYELDFDSWLGIFLFSGDTGRWEEAVYMRDDNL